MTSGNGNGDNGGEGGEGGDIKGVCNGNIGGFKRHKEETEENSSEVLVLRSDEVDALFGSVENKDILVSDDGNIGDILSEELFKVRGGKEDAEDENKCVKEHKEDISVAQ